MNKDSKLIFEALQSKFTQPQGTETYALNQLERMIQALEGISTAIHMSKSSAIDQQLSRLRDTAEMLMSERGSGTSENAEDSAEQRIAAAKANADKARQQIAQAKLQGQMKHYGDGLARSLGKPENAESPFHYDPMPGLEKTANQIRDLLQGAANDEARTEHIIKMAQTILGSPNDYNPNEYRKMLDGLIVLLNRFIVVPMN